MLHFWQGSVPRLPAYDSSHTNESREDNTIAQPLAGNGSFRQATWLTCPSSFADAERQRCFADSGAKIRRRVSFHNIAMFRHLPDVHQCDTMLRRLWRDSSWEANQGQERQAPEVFREINSSLWRMNRSDGACAQVWRPMWLVHVCESEKTYYSRIKTNFGKCEYWNMSWHRWHILCMI